MVAARPSPAVATRGRSRHVRPASVQFRPMGVLDDAIREHLELKRKHGAAEEELERQEDEALGPARREVAQEPAEEAGEPVSETEAASDEPVLEEDAGFEEVEAAGEAPVAGEEPESAEPPVAGEAPTEFIDHAATLDAEPDGAVAEEPAVVEPPPAEGPAPAEEEPPAPGRASRDDEVESWLEEEEPPAEASGAEDEESKDGDVLEDTPDFLQETPEHDRLWFEQKPPRDFDFD